MKEQRKDKMRLTHILEAIERLEKHAGRLTREELETDVLRYYGISLSMSTSKLTVIRSGKSFMVILLN